MNQWMRKAGDRRQEAGGSKAPRQKVEGTEGEKNFSPPYMKVLSPSLPPLSLLPPLPPLLPSALELLPLLFKTPEQLGTKVIFAIGWGKIFIWEMFRSLTTHTRGLSHF